MSKSPYSKDPRFSYRLDANGEIHRIEGEQDLVVARYDAKTQAVFFKKVDLRKFKKEVITFMAEDEIKYKSMQREDMPADPVSDSIPKRPKMDKLMGDKTPAVVDWYRQYKPNEFLTRYGVYDQRYTGPVKEIVNDYIVNSAGKEEFRGTIAKPSSVVDALVAERKTHVTFTPEECLNWDDQYNAEDDES